MAQLKEGSVIRKSTGDEIIATINDLDGIAGKDGEQGLQGIKGDDGVGGGLIVDLGTFNDTTELITHVVMNQLPTGHYTFIMEDFPFFMLLRQLPDRYNGTFHDNIAIFYYFEVSFYGEIQELKSIDLRDLMSDVSL